MKIFARPTVLFPVVLVVTIMRGAADSTPAPLPWEREPRLKEAARAVVITGTLDPQQPAQGANVGSNTLSNTQVRAALWGPSDRITLSLLKSDVWDRRYGIAPTVTLEQVKAGAFSPANRGFDDMPPNQRRPVRGYLLPEGGRVDPYACWNAYPFPCEKPVGQIILGMDELADVPAPSFARNCADGVVRLELKNEKARADLQILLPMTRNVIAVRGHVEGVATPWLRVFRHVDQAFRRYMTADQKSFLPRTPGAASGAIPVGEVRPAQVPFDYAKDAAWNGPVAPPESGRDGRYFWIHQRFPPEKTFPQGFDYVLMGVAATAGEAHIETASDQRSLGTPPTGVRGEALQRLEDGYRVIRDAPGAAATLSLPPDRDGNIAAYVTVVTCNDAADPFAEGRRQLDEAAAAGFEKLAAENTAWFARFYDQREEGRIFRGNEKTVSESIPQIFQSWTIRHGGGNQLDMRRYESTASYANVEQDWQLWHSLPCYNELFYTPVYVRNRADSAAMWWKLIEAWRAASRDNAREVYGAKGMALVHGYLPPVKPDRYVHTSVALEYCIDTIAQMVKPLWDEWDYGGDAAFLREKTYPAMRDVAEFYASYAQKDAEGFYHFIPSLEAEAWGIFPEFARARDTISSLCMARWTFAHAADAAELLQLDADLRQHWREIAAHLAPFPIFETKDGPIFNSVAGTVPSHQQGDHGWYIGLYPTSLSDEINLDSSETLRAQMIRTAAAVPTARSREISMLLGASHAAADRAGSADGARFEQFPEALLNSRSGRIHLFPDAAAGDVVAFRHFQARDGFLVSAAKDASGVTFVEIEARRTISCRLMNPWPGRTVEIHAAKTGKRVHVTTDDSNGECLVFEVDAGERYRLTVSPL